MRTFSLFYMPMLTMINRKKAGILFAATLITANLLLRCSPKPDTFLNLDPKVKYTGTQSCQPCHKKIYQSFIETGMGKSLYRPDTSRVIESFGPDAVTTDPKSDFAYFPFWLGGEMLVREFRLSGKDTIYQRTEKVDYVVGSGHQTRSYLMERNGYLYEFPITWYVSKQIWDLSPGYHENNTRFGREIGKECMNCHTGYTEYIEGSKNRYKFISEGIDCEKCHGPGEEHIRLTEAGQLIDVGEKTDYSIVNPGKLPLDLQFDVCQQCHLQGINVLAEGKSIDDFRPGTPLSATFDVFIERQADENMFGIASHAERLQQSRCFIASEGKLTCTTCHDPHKSVTLAGPEVYILQCNRCHEKMNTPACSAPEADKHATGNNCVSCHMPAGGTSDIPHVRFHDHRIRVVAQQPDAPVDSVKAWLKLATRKEVGGRVWGEAWLLYFEQHNQSVEYLNRAAAYSAQMNPYDQARVAFYQQNYPLALSFADSALAAGDDHSLIWFLKGEILEAQTKYAEAAAAYRRSFEENPEGTDAGLKAGTMLLRARQGDRAVLPEVRMWFENLLKTKPFDERLLTNLGFVVMNEGDYTRAERLFQEALSFDPDNIAALENMILLQLISGNREMAEKFLKHLERKHPGYSGLERLQSAF
ncbi:MAG: tetratricopeptide repeat protein [Bacteroidia bacterium]